MHRLDRVSLGIISLIVLLTATIVAQQNRQEEAEKYYKKWLDQDVVYIITQEERDVFSKLSTMDEKDQFIEQFWLRRDPDLRTALNEYKEEHYRRIAYANQKFGSGIPGWKTDRGRIYITFGEPAQVEYNAGGGTYVRPSYEGSGRTATYPFEIWRYRHIPGIGDDIEIEFVDRSWTGEFKLALYPWEKDMLLHVDGLGETLSERFGLTSRHERPGLHPGHLNNTNYMKKFMGSRFKDRPFARLQQFFNLQRPPKIEQEELQKIVETQVSYRQLPVNTYIHHIWITEESALVPMTIEVPHESLTFTLRPNGLMKARVGVYGRVTSLGGRVEAEFEETLAKEYREDQVIAGRKQGSLYQKLAVLPTGRHKIELVVKDLESGNIGTASKSVNLRRPKPDNMEAGPLLLALQIESLDSFPDEPQSFTIGDMRVVPKVDSTFLPGEDLGVYLQVYNPVLDSSSSAPIVSVEYLISQGDKTVSSFTDGDGSSVEFYSKDRLVLTRKMNLEHLEAGRYRLTVKVNDLISGKTTTAQANFRVAQSS